MTRYKYVIVGGGMTGDAAAQGIRELDPSGAILLVGSETHNPYNRPPLTKGLWKGESEETIWRPIPTGTEVLLGRRIVALDAKRKQVTDDKGTIHEYDKLLLATGGTPRRLPLQSDRMIYYRTYDDYRRLHPNLARPARGAVVGGGLLGSGKPAARPPPDT